jgi:hypothetical protein
MFVFWNWLLLWILFIIISFLSWINFFYVFSFSSFIVWIFLYTWIIVNNYCVLFWLIIFLLLSFWCWEFFYIKLKPLKNNILWQYFIVKTINNKKIIYSDSTLFYIDCDDRLNDWDSVEILEYIDKNKFKVKKTM